ncbi:MAG: S1 RNA-binding domain-containing protein, partial [Dehalococcoidales bacterium]|nr:S1 RNA-binding domain-containing protein [Dehalococcoidales bacterium]
VINELKGTVRNVVDFGAFVDIGVKQDGLVHISQLRDGYVANPLNVVAVGDIVTVTVLSVDVARGRIALSMKGVSSP